METIIATIIETIIKIIIVTVIVTMSDFVRNFRREIINKYNKSYWQCSWAQLLIHGQRVNSSYNGIHFVARRHVNSVVGLLSDWLQVNDRKLSKEIAK